MQHIYAKFYMSICKLCFLPGNKFYLAENFPLALSMIFPIPSKNF